MFGLTVGMRHDGARKSAVAASAEQSTADRASVPGPFVPRVDELLQVASRRVGRVHDAIEALLLPPETTSGAPTNEDYRRIILFVAIPAVSFFLPSLILAKVPVVLWLPFTAAAVAAAVWISAMFLLVPRSAPMASCLAAVGNALVVAGLGLLYRDYFHEITLLYVLLVASHAVVHGLTPALAMVVLGPVIVPLMLADPRTANVTDPYYAALYLLGAALIPWVGSRLAERRADLLSSLRRASETERSRLAAILASMSDAVLVVDPEGSTVITNAAYQRLFLVGGREIELDDGRGRPLPRNRWPQARAARGARFKMSFTTGGPNGERRWFEATGGPIGSDSGLIGGVVTIRDITDRSLRRLEEQFVATASHELRTPVAALHGYLQLLERHIDPATGPREAEYAKSALAQTRRLGGLLDRLFDLARLQMGRLQVDLSPFSPVPLVRRVVASAQSLTDQDIQLDVTAEPLLVEADPGRLEEVLLNVLGNAIGHAHESKRIEVRLRFDDRWAEIEVEDFGPGMPAAELSRVFTRSSRSRQSQGRGSGGLGLGLYLSRQLMRAQGGSIEIASRAGSGTTVQLRIPLAAAPARRPRTPSSR
jgi:signal transduction histidine kinase